LQPRQAFAFGPFIALGIWMVWLRGADWWGEQWQRLLGF
jgi:leader peptidase (prepilin peptidase)/N-methyltransferase